MKKADFLKAKPAEKRRFICDFVRSRVSASEMGTRPYRDRWKKAENMFAGLQDWGAERVNNDWMSRPFFHEFSATVRNVASAAQDLIFQRPDFFTLVPTEEGDLRLSKIFEKILRYYFSQINLENATEEYLLIGGIYGIATSKFTVKNKVQWSGEAVIEEITKQEEKARKKLPKDIEQSEVMTSDEDLAEEKLEEALAALVGGGGYKPPELKPKKRLTLGFELEFVNPFNHFFEPDVSDINRSAWRADRYFKKLYMLDSLFADGTLDKKQRSKLKGYSYKGGDFGGIMGNYEGQKLFQREQFMSPEDMPDDIVKIEEWWGPIWDEDGETIYENYRAIVANDKVLLAEGTNPYFSQEVPHNTAVFSRRPFVPVGQGVADNGIQQNEMINDFFGLWLDLLRLIVYRPMTYESSKLVNPNQIEGYIKPGELIDVMGAKPGDIFGQIPSEVSQVGPWLFQTIEALRLSADKGSGVMTQTANPASRARITAAEVNSNIGRASESMLTLGRELDANYLIPLCKKLLGYALQFGFELDALNELETVGAITPEEKELVAGIPKIERYNEIRRNYKVKIAGFRERIEKDQWIGKMNEALAVLGPNPEMAKHINWKELLQQYFGKLDFDTDSLIYQNTPHDKAMEENGALANNQMVACGEQDDDAAELPAHYQRAIVEPTEAMIAHIGEHINRVLANGGQPPPPPKELEQFFMPPQQSEGPPGGATIQ